MPPMDMNLLLKTLRVDVPRFDGLNVDNRIYRINKFFSLHHIDPGTRLAMVCKNFFFIHNSRDKKGFNKSNKRV